MTDLKVTVQEQTTIHTKIFSSFGKIVTNFAFLKTRQGKMQIRALHILDDVLLAYKIFQNLVSLRQQSQITNPNIRTYITYIYEHGNEHSNY